MRPDLIVFIRQRRMDIPASDIHPHSRMAGDFGMVGLDALEFFEDFFDEFNIPNLDDFDFDLHVEGSPDFVKPIGTRIKNLFIKERRKHLWPDVTMGHLNEVLNRGVWFNER